MKQFITDWLLKSRGGAKDGQWLVKVYFADEPDIPFKLLWAKELIEEFLESGRQPESPLGFQARWAHARPQLASFASATSAGRKQFSATDS